ncbi:MAG: DNA-deoxyinosine glycosylase [Steroidobacteraceae bacterium]
MDGFPPVARRDARLLILGSMPGAASLAAGEYYAHPRNAFWTIVGGLGGAAADARYARRTAALRATRIALWDVIASCRRRGSLDAAIERGSVRVNDFAGFLARHPRIACVAFNGGTAEALFRRHVLPRLAAAGTARPLRLLRLPSTSPAHAGLTLARKRAAWHRALRAALGAAAARVGRAAP